MAAPRNDILQQLEDRLSHYWQELGGSLRLSGIESPLEPLLEAAIAEQNPSNPQPRLERATLFARLFPPPGQDEEQGSDDDGAAAFEYQLQAKIDVILKQVQEYGYEIIDAHQASQAVAANAETLPPTLTDAGSSLPTSSESGDAKNKLATGAVPNDGRGQGDETHCEHVPSANAANAIDQSAKELKRLSLPSTIIEDSHNFQEALPELYFLLLYYHYLSGLQKAYVKEREKLQKPVFVPLETKVHRATGIIASIFNVGKKLIDFLEDGWYQLQKVFSKKVIDTVGPLLTGAVGVLISIGEAYYSIKQIVLAAKGKIKKHRKLQLGVAIASLTLAIAALGSSAGYGLLIFGIKVAAQATLDTLPFFMTFFLGCIYTINLGKNIYLYLQAKSKLKLKRDMYFKNLKEYEPELLKIYRELKALQSLRLKHANDPKRLQVIIMRELACHNCLAQIQGQLKVYEQSYQKAKNKSFELRRDMVFNVIEVVATALIAMSIVFSLKALLILSVPTLGAAPLLALGVLGMTLGSGSKIFEMIDEKLHLALSKKIGKFFNAIGQAIHNSFTGNKAKPAAPPALFDTPRKFSTAFLIDEIIFFQQHNPLLPRRSQSDSLVTLAKPSTSGQPPLLQRTESDPGAGGLEPLFPPTTQKLQRCVSSDSILPRKSTAFKEDVLVKQLKFK